MKASKFLNNLTIITIAIATTGCGIIKKETYNEKLSRFSKNDDYWVCGKYYGLEFFTGQKDKVSEVDKMVAREIIGNRKTSCEKYQSRLEQSNISYANIFLKEKEIRDRNSRLDELEDQIRKNKRKIDSMETDNLINNTQKQESIQEWRERRDKRLGF